MRKRVTHLTTVACAAALCGATATAQTSEGNPASRRPPAAAQSTLSPAATVPPDAVANEIALLRKSLQTLSARLREVGEKALAPEARAGGQQNSIVLNFELLSRAEQRAETLRRQLIELTEKEVSLKNRLVQLEDEMRPDSIERFTSMTGSTRTPELREARRRVLENERRGVEILLGQAAPNRARLEEDVRQADSLVTKLRQRVLPAIEKEIDKLPPE